MASVSSIGTGSGVLTNDLIDKLIDAEREPVEARLDAKEDSVNAQLSDFGRIQSAVTDLPDPLSPTNATVSPLPTSKLTPRTAWVTSPS